MAETDERNNIMKRCLFCGQAKAALSQTQLTSISPEHPIPPAACDRCGANLGGGFDTTHFAVTAWNRRA